MSYFILFLLFLIVSCSTPKREVASVDEAQIYFPADSKILKFHATSSRLENSKLPFIKLTSQNLENEFVDINEDSIRIKVDSDEEYIRPIVERVEKGKYYFSFVDGQIKRDDRLIIYFGDNRISNLRREVASTKIDFKKSSLKVVQKELSSYQLELKLYSTNSKIFSTNELPEILLDGVGSIGQLTQTAPGVWRFKLLIPNDNQVLYLGVQVNGQSSHNLLRLQYVGE